MVRQQDYWDSVNLAPGGCYSAEPKAQGFADLLHQLAPGGAQAQAASERELPYQLLRRAADYEVRRYPLYVAGQHRVRAAALAPLLANERKCLKSRASCRGNCVGRRVGRGLNKSTT